MAEKSSRERGREVARKLLGEETAKTAEEALGNMSPAFQEWVMESFAVYDGPALDFKTRRVITIAVLIALGRSQELDLHLRTSLLTDALTKEQIKAIITQVAFYAGVPFGVDAFRVANKVFEDIKEKG